MKNYLQRIKGYILVFLAGVLVTLMLYPLIARAKSVPQVKSEPPAQVVPVYVEPTTKEEVKQLIIEVATRYGVDTTLALRIANAESGFNCKAQNKTSSAGGLYQFINSTWLSTQKRMGRPQTLDNKKNCLENAESAMFLLSKGELSHWNASLSAWK